MNAARFRLVGYLTLALGAAAGGGYGWARTLHTPPIVEIGSTACGVPPSTAHFGVPLQTIIETAGGVPFGVGPVEVPDGGGSLSLRFVPSIDGAAREVRLVDDTLYLPTEFGPSHHLPRRITLHCREGGIGSVRYQGDGRESATFNVAREANAALTRGGFDPPCAACPTEPFPAVN